MNRKLTAVLYRNHLHYFRQQDFWHLSEKNNNNIYRNISCSSNVVCIGSLSIKLYIYLIFIQQCQYICMSFRCSQSLINIINGHITALYTQFGAQLASLNLLLSAHGKITSVLISWYFRSQCLGYKCTSAFIQVQQILKK